MQLIINNFNLYVGGLEALFLFFNIFRHRKNKYWNSCYGK